MPFVRHVFILGTLIALIAIQSLQAAATSPPVFQPDPQSIQRYGPAYRYPQAGWIVLHIEGKPYERGYQHGRLLAEEICAFIRCFAALQSSKAPAEGWKNTRSLVNALFLRRYQKEYLEEMKGIADGATAAGARFDNRHIDLVDIVSLNVWPEVETLASALEATPTGLEGYRFPHLQPLAIREPKPMHCSAFAATAPATTDGKIVFGHITMFSLYPALFYNIWLDVKPDAGHRVFMQTYPGGIQSGLDYYFNDVGLLVCETTIAQTRFNIEGMSVASRIREALQYADTIDKAVQILKTANNGLYTNEWLLADIKTNEIAMFELGTAKSKLFRSSKKEWFGGTDGFYWGCNNTKDLDVRLETIASVLDRPTNVVWHPSDRDKMWLELFNKHRGKIDPAFGKEAFTTPPIAAYHSLDAKYTTTDLAKELKTWALFGPPLGKTWKPTKEERQRYPEIRSLPSNPWTVLHANPPNLTSTARTQAVDLSESVDNKDELALIAEDDKPLPIVPAWQGTILPKADSDIWLASAFAEYERLVANEHALRHRRTDGKLLSRDRDLLAVELFAHRSNYTIGARAGNDVGLSNIRNNLLQEAWYRIAVGKGVMVLHELRHLLGDNKFCEMMDSFGRQHAGKPVSVADFQAHVIKASGNNNVEGFFAYWLKQPGLPRIHMTDVKMSHQNKTYRVRGMIRRESSAPPSTIEITVVGSHGETTKSLSMQAASTPFEIDTTALPQRLIADKYAWMAKANGGPFSIFSFLADLRNTLIVYGTVDEVSTNHEAALAVQRGIVELWSNFTVPVKTDQEVTDQQIQSHHVLLIGRPDSNSLVSRFRNAFPLAFGQRSFMVGQETYAHPGSAVVAAAENPLNRAYSMVLISGLGAESTLLAPLLFLRRGQRSAEVLILPNHNRPKAMVVPARELEMSLTIVEKKADGAHQARSIKRGNRSR